MRRIATREEVCFTYRHGSGACAEYRTMKQKNLRQVTFDREVQIKWPSFDHVLTPTIRSSTCGAQMNKKCTVQASSPLRVESDTLVETPIGGSSRRSAWGTAVDAHCLGSPCFVSSSRLSREFISDS